MNKQIKSYTDFTSQIRMKVWELYCADFGPVIELNCSLETQLNQSGLDASLCALAARVLDFVQQWPDIGILHVSAIVKSHRINICGMPIIHPAFSREAQANLFHFHFHHHLCNMYV